MIDWSNLSSMASTAGSSSVRLKASCSVRVTAGFMPLGPQTPKGESLTVL